jgi:hypothetical protein
MKVFRFFVFLTLGFGLTFGPALPTLADPPSNDTFAGATLIGELPFEEIVDTSEATTDEIDAELNASCGAPATDASVWYSLTLDQATPVLVDVSASGYSAGVIVAAGEPGSFEVVSCEPGVVGFFAEAGVTYSILVFDDQLDGGGNGGTLHISVVVPPPPPEIQLTVDPAGRFDPQTGNALLSGTFTCVGEAAFVELFGDVSQRAGRAIIRGFFSLFSFDGKDHSSATEKPTHGPPKCSPTTACSREETRRCRHLSLPVTPRSSAAPTLSSSRQSA